LFPERTEDLVKKTEREVLLEKKKKQTRRDALQVRKKREGGLVKKRNIERGV
jgi:hypothetical protein